jgi:peptidyl-prolyl cis-trans isomerase D
MLGTFRKASQSWPAKIFFGLLTLSFVGWGVGDVIRGRFDNPSAISVGDQKIGPDVVVTEFRRDADRIQRQTGGKISVDQLRQMGFLNQTIQRLVSQALVDQEGVRLGIAVDDDTVRKAIAQIPAFRNQLDAFDPNLYRQALSANGLSETRFESMEREDIQRSEMADMVTGGAVAPDPLVDPIFRYRFEQRVVELIPFEAKAMPAPAAPDQPVLEAYHKDHAAQFTAPESRSLTALVLHAADTVVDFKPSDDQVNKAYEERQGEFATEETRHLQQVFFSDKASAQKLVDAIKGGASLADAAKAAGKEVDDLGDMTRKSLPIPALADAAFSVDVPGVAGPVESPLGWNVLYIADRKPGSVKPLAEVRPQLVAELTKAESIARVNALSTKLEDAVGSGASLEDIAANLKVKVLKLANIDANGHGADGKPVPDMPDSAAFRDAAVKTAKGSVSEVIALENDEGYAALRVDDVTPPALKPFDSVRDAVLAAWTKDRQVEEAKAAADVAADRLNKGESAEAVAGKIKVTVTKGFTRNGDESVPAPVAAAAFKLELGHAASVPVGDTAYALRLSSIVPADPKADSANLDQVRDQLARNIEADLNQQYLMALQQQIGVKISPAVIERQFSQNQ